MDPNVALASRVYEARKAFALETARAVLDSLTHGTPLHKLGAVRWFRSEAIGYVMRDGEGFEVEVSASHDSDTVTVAAARITEHTAAEPTRPARPSPDGPAYENGPTKWGLDATPASIAAHYTGAAVWMP